jgi:hypothetical protein
LAGQGDIARLAAAAGQVELFVNKVQRRRVGEPKLGKLFEVLFKRPRQTHLPPLVHVELDELDKEQVTEAIGCGNIDRGAVGRNRAESPARREMVGDLGSFTPLPGGGKGFEACCDRIPGNGRRFVRLVHALIPASLLACA